MWSYQHNLSSISCKTWNVVHAGPQICIIRTANVFIMDHLWSWHNHNDGELVLISKQVVLLTKTAKVCYAIRTPCCERKKQNLLKPSHVWIQTSQQTLGDFSRWWFYFTTRGSNSTTSLVFFCPIRPISNQNTGWTLIN